MNYWITTDTHFGHKKLVDEGARPERFESLILKRLKDVLRPDDILIHLGDVSFKDDKDWHSILIEMSPCKKWLIRGNHDNHSDTWYMARGWDFVGNLFRMKKFGANIVFSHIPTLYDSYDLNIHGHFHNSDIRKHEPAMLAIANERQVLVALELTHYAPVNLRRLVRENLRV